MPVLLNVDEFAALIVPRVFDGCISRIRRRISASVWYLTPMPALPILEEGVFYLLSILLVNLLDLPEGILLLLQVIVDVDRLVRL